MLAACSKRFSTKNLVGHSLGSKRYTGANRPSFRADQGKQNKSTPYGWLTRLLATTIFYTGKGAVFVIFVPGKCPFLPLT